MYLSVSYISLKQAFVLVSTAFSQTNDIKYLEEKYYPSSIDPSLMERIIETTDENILDALTPKYFFLHISTFFSSYIFLLFLLVFYTI